MTNNQSYEEYIRSILGYPNNMTSSMLDREFNDNNSYNMSNRTNTENSMLENCYPEIYKIVYPMVTTACQNNTMPITSQLVENMTDEIYSAVESNTEIGINITLKNQVKATQTRENNATQSVQRDGRTVANMPEKKEVENRGEDRQFRNRNLRDLIKILLIRELLGTPGFPPQRPPVPPRPPVRPPFPGGPMPGPRPPFMPRDGKYYDDLYEEG